MKNAKDFIILSLEPRLTHASFTLNLKTLNILMSSHLRASSNMSTGLQEGITAFQHRASSPQGIENLTTMISVSTRLSV